MKNWIKLIIVLIVCIIVVGSVYVWKFGLPSFLSREEEYMDTIYSTLDLDDENITVKLDNKKIIFTKEDEEEPQTIEFEVSDGVISAIVPDSISEEFMNTTIKVMFMAATKLNEQSEENAIYSLIPDVIVNKTLSDDGFSLITQNGVTRFSMKINKKFNLANGQEVYIKDTDIKAVEDIIKYKLQSKIIEKPGIVFEKTVSYSDDLIYIIYEKDKLTDRAYNSLLSLITVLISDKLDYVKTNYPVITRAGTLQLDGISISLNEKINVNNVHSYNMPADYEYMIVRINANMIER